MSESPTLYKTNNIDEKAYPQTFTIQMPQITKLSDLQQMQGRKQSAIVRDAIDRYHSIENDARLIELAEFTQISKTELVDRAIELLYSKIETIKSSE